MPDPTIPDAAVDAYERVFQTTPFDADDALNRVRAGLAAAYPLLAAHALRDVADAVIRPLAERYEASGDVFDADSAAALREALAKVTALADATRPGSVPRAPEPSACTRYAGDCASCGCVLDEGHRGRCDIHCGQRRAPEPSVDAAATRTPVPKPAGPAAITTAGARHLPGAIVECPECWQQVAVGHHGKFMPHARPFNGPRCVRSWQVAP